MGFPLGVFADGAELLTVRVMITSSGAQFDPPPRPHVSDSLGVWAALSSLGGARRAVDSFIGALQSKKQRSEQSLSGGVSQVRALNIRPDG